MEFKKKLDDELMEIQLSGRTPRLLLHCCCAPCTCYVLEYLASFFNITILFYNPNIRPREEFYKRVGEFQKIPAVSEYPNCVNMVFGDYDSDVFDSVAMSFPEEPEGGLRCRACFELRLRETVRHANEGGFEYFATTLSVSPHKSAALINEIGSGLEGDYGVRFLCADFKKRDGYKRSVELSKQYGLYRQSYCGCERSRAVSTLQTSIANK